ncbi:hypothetical protein M422DRAFT_241394 [Sphaerobolus stellatus SS14]|nr:hypothetical protein M422DRAFT_241394 [Sphaerobolus stellatus SS14]
MIFGTDLSRYTSLYSSIFIGVIIIIGLQLFIASVRREQKLSKIPIVGHSGYISSYIDVFRFLTHARETIQEGYDKYHPGLFRIPSFKGWRIIITGEDHIEELRKSHEVLSFETAIQEDLALDYTLGRSRARNQYHADIIRSRLTGSSSLAEVFPEMYDEVVVSFRELISTSTEWKTYKVFECALNLVSRVSTRVIVGLPVFDLGRNSEYTKLNVDFALSIMVIARLLGLFPRFLWPFLSKIFLGFRGSPKRAIKHLSPLIAEREAARTKFGKDYLGKPNDMLSWIMDAAPPEEQNDEDYTMRILTVGFAALSTTAMIFTHCILNLASHPEHIEPMRKEIEEVTSIHGWTKQALDKAVKLDSFIREVLRVSALGAVNMTRTALQDHTFSDGTTIPKGSRLYIAHISRHMDEHIYSNANEFNGFRFSDLGDSDLSPERKQAVATSPDFLTFGHGKNACPGRFFAVTELKTLLAHLILTYDMKPGAPYKLKWFQEVSFIDPEAEIIFRKRES